MFENFIFSDTRALFEKALANGEILDEAVVFIKDTKEIWNHGTYFDCSSVNVDDYTTTDELNAALANYVKASSLSKVATSGSYNDLSNKPAIPQYAVLYTEQALEEQAKQQACGNIGAIQAKPTNGITYPSVTIK